MPLQQMQNLQESPNEAGDGNPKNPEDARMPEGEKPHFWIWIAIALIVFLTISAGIYFWIFG